MIAKTCSRCGSEFGCGRDEPSCWCNAMPPLPANSLLAQADCLCAACLRARLRELAEDDAAAHAPGPDPAS